jgi:hypothetical protein
MHLRYEYKFFIWGFRVLELRIQRLRILSVGDKLQ